MYKIGILGVGKMGSAILNGIIKSNLYKKDEILLYIHNLEKLESYKKEGYIVTNNCIDIFNESNIILLGIKPQMFEEVLKDAKKIDFKDRCVISIAAGLTINYVSKFFKNAFIVRCMPNTPSQIGKGVSTLTSLDNSNHFYKEAFNIFSSIGISYEVDEKYMDDSVVLNGSMPAYLFYFAKCFIDFGMSKGLDYNTAKALTLETMKSSCDLALQDDTNIDILINNVCSKGGTTIEGLNKLIDNNLKDTVFACSEACAKRSKELSK